MIEYMHPVTQAAFEDELEKLAAARRITKLPGPGRYAMPEGIHGLGAAASSSGPSVPKEKIPDFIRRQMVRAKRYNQRDAAIRRISSPRVDSKGGSSRPSTYGRRSGQGGAPGEAPSNWKRGATIVGGASAGVGSAELARRHFARRRNRD